MAVFARAGLLLWLICYSSIVPAQNVRAVLDKESVFEGESVFLTIEVQGDVGGESPEVGLLTDSFEILGSQSQTQLQIINNQQTVLRTWQFELEPKTTGELAIPALTIGPKIQTPPLALTVLPGGQQDDVSQDIFIELSAEPLDPYVQEQVRYRERIFLAAPLTDETLRREGAINNALLQPLGEQKRYIATREGRNYQVFERNYALIPEKSGSIILPRLVLRGRIGNRQPGQLVINRGRRVQVQSEAVVLQVRPRPAGYEASPGQTWLPSWELSLSEQWSPSPPVFRVGEPLTRTLILQAKGLDAGQLPNLELPVIDNVNVYPDQPQSATSSDAEWLLGQREQKIALVPTQAGELTLPEIKLAWWNTQQDQAQTAVLPARTVTVLPAIGSPKSSPTAETRATPPETSPIPSGHSLDHSLEAHVPFLSDRRIWQGISLALLIVWLGTALAWWRERRRMPKNAEAPSKASQKPSQRSLRQALQRACQTHDAPDAAHSLLQLAMQQWPQNPPTSLGALAARCPNIARAVLELDRALYSNGSGPDSSWQGVDLWRAAQDGIGPVKTNAKSKRDTDDGLAVMYPQRP